MSFSKIISVDENFNFSEMGTAKNFVVHSRLKSFEKKDKKTALSIKAVKSGVERYTINQQRYDLEPGYFLLVDGNQEMDISFNEKQLAEGCCLYIDQTYMNQIANLSEKGANWALDHPLENENNCAFLSMKYKIRTDDFGQFLSQTIIAVTSNPTLHLSEDFFMQLAQQLFLQQHQVSSTLNKLNSLKLTTRQELYKRVMLVRDFIEDQPQAEKLSIHRLAQIAAMSEVQLHRAFKSILGQTPHQFILERKMKIAQELIQCNSHTLSEIAWQLGFSDLPTFSKAFKRHFKISPVKFYPN